MSRGASTCAPQFSQMEQKEKRQDFSGEKQMGGSKTPPSQAVNTSRPRRTIKSISSQRPKTSKSIPTKFRMGTPAYRGSTDIRGRPKPASTRVRRAFVPAILARDRDERGLGVLQRQPPTRKLTNSHEARESRRRSRLGSARTHPQTHDRHRGEIPEWNKTHVRSRLKNGHAANFEWTNTKTIEAR